MKDLFPGEDLFVLACLWVLACGLAWGASGLGLGLDFFYDEVWSLTNYVFVSPWATVSQLPVPNNHIFWNLLVNFWTKIFDLDLATVLRHPWTVRILPAAFSVGVLIYTYRLGRWMAGRETGLLAVAVLASSLPFWNFATAMRGYAANMFFVSAGICYAAALPRWFGYEKPSQAWARPVVCASLATWTLPTSPLALLVAPVTPLSVGVLLGFLFYMPVWPGLWAISSGGGGPAEWPWTVLAAFSSNRWVVALAIPGLILFWKNRAWCARKNVTLLSFILLASVTIGQALGWPDRTLVCLLPIFSVLVATGLWAAVGWSRVATGAVVALLFVGFWVGAIRSRDGLEANAWSSPSEKVYTLSATYNQFGYHPRELLERFDASRDRAVPVVLAECDRVALPAYLWLQRIEWLGLLIGDGSMGTMANTYMIGTGLPEGGRAVDDQGFHKISFFGRKEPR